MYHSVKNAKRRIARIQIALLIALEVEHAMLSVRNVHIPMQIPTLSIQNFVQNVKIFQSLVKDSVETRMHAIQNSVQRNVVKNVQWYMKLQPLE
jgi:hypothetical protein